jgi:catechol 2,3-dioxygenase-like lactoylglutathione lyase family enzyme
VKDLLVIESARASLCELVGVHHIGLTVRDLDQSIRLYRDILGMTLVRRRRIQEDYVAQQTGLDGVVLDAASLQVSAGLSPSIELVRYLTHGGVPAHPAVNRPGNTHLCFITRDLRAAHEVLLEKGVRFKSQPVRITAGPNKDGLVIYFLDPDGYTLELFEPASPAGAR